jgi:hypothetical protein
MMNINLSNIKDFISNNSHIISNNDMQNLTKYLNQMILMSVLKGKVSNTIINITKELLYVNDE